MSDDRFSYLHVSHLLTEALVDEEDEKLGWDLPDDDLDIPAHLIPPYQDEDDETLPSMSHPSYPYGNPYNTSSTSRTLPLPLFAASSQSHSLSTTLPNLALRHLYSQTTFGEAKDRQWTEMALDELVEEAPKDKDQEALEKTQTGDVPAGDIPPPQDQDPDPPETAPAE